MYIDGNKIAFHIIILCNFFFNVYTQLDVYFVSSNSFRVISRSPKKKKKNHLKGINFPSEKNSTYKKIIVLIFYIHKFQMKSSRPQTLACRFRSSPSPFIGSETSFHGRFIFVSLSFGVSTSPSAHLNVRFHSTQSRGGFGDFFHRCFGPLRFPFDLVSSLLFSTRGERVGGDGLGKPHSSDFPIDEICGDEHSTRDSNPYTTSQGKKKR